MKPHKHAALIKAWADGSIIQWYNARANAWEDEITPCWNAETTYRIKPEPKPDYVYYAQVWKWGDSYGFSAALFRKDRSDNLKITFDGETGKLKSVEIIK